MTNPKLADELTALIDRLRKVAMLADYPGDHRLVVAGDNLAVDDVKAAADALAAMTARSDGWREGVEAAAEVMDGRVTLYQTKAEKRDPFADDSMNSFEGSMLCAEASEYGADAIRNLTPPAQGR